MSGQEPREDPPSYQAQGAYEGSHHAFSGPEPPQNQPLFRIDRFLSKEIVTISLPRSTHPRLSPSRLARERLPGRGVAFAAGDERRHRRDVAP